MSATNVRDWHYGDEPCPFPGGCSEPWRTHYHYLEAPGKPVVVIYYDQPLLEQAHHIPAAPAGTVEAPNG